MSIVPLVVQEQIHTERDVTITNDGVSLHGTLTVPSSREASTVILMLHGSGPLDRDENMKGQALDVFNTLAGKLAEAGYASLRYDKRGCGASEGDYYSSGHTDHLSDASAWTDALSSSHFGRFEQVYLLGHSLGTLIGAQIAQRNDAIAGLIQICPFIEMLESALRRQAATIQAELDQSRGMLKFFVNVSTFLFGQPARNQERLINRLKTRNDDTFRLGFQKIDAKSLRELMTIAPADQYRGLQPPIFLLGAEKDLQCDPQDCYRIAELVGDNASVHIEPDLTHILRKDTRPPSFYAYHDQLEHPPDPVVAELIIGWLRKSAANQVDVRV